MTEFVNEHIATNLYFDNNFNIQAVKLLPGEYFEIIIKEIGRAHV